MSVQQTKATGKAEKFRLKLGGKVRVCVCVHTYVCACVCTRVWVSLFAPTLFI